MLRSDVTTHSTYITAIRPQIFTTGYLHISLRHLFLASMYQVSNSEQRTANSEQRTANSEQQTANSEQRQAGLIPFYISTPQHRPLASNRDSVAADFYLPLSHRSAVASHQRATPKTTCAAAPIFYSVAENCCAAPKTICAEAPNFCSVTNYRCAMSSTICTVVLKFYSVTKTICAARKIICAMAPHHGVAAHLNTAPLLIFKSFHSTFHSLKTTESWHE